MQNPSRELLTRDMGPGIGFALGEVRVPVEFDHRVMHRIDTGLSGRWEPAAMDKADANNERPCHFAQTRSHHMP